MGGTWRNEEQLVTFMTSLSRPIRLPGLAKHEDGPPITLPHPPSFSPPSPLPPHPSSPHSPLHTYSLLPHSHLSLALFIPPSLPHPYSLPLSLILTPLPFLTLHPIHPHLNTLFQFFIPSTSQFPLNLPSSSLLSFSFFLSFSFLYTTFICLFFCQSHKRFHTLSSCRELFLGNNNENKKIMYRGLDTPVRLAQVCVGRSGAATTSTWHSSSIINRQVIRLNLPLHL